MYMYLLSPDGIDKEYLKCRLAYGITHMHADAYISDSAAFNRTHEFSQQLLIGHMNLHICFKLAMH